LEAAWSVYAHEATSASSPCAGAGGSSSELGSGENETI